MKVNDILLEAASLDDVAKKHNLKKVTLPRFHDAKDIKRYALQSPGGKTIIEIQVTPKDYADEKGPIEVSHDRKRNYFKKMADAVSYIEKLTVTFDEAIPTDDKIIKWLNNQWGIKITKNDTKNLRYIEWGPKATQVVERSGDYFQIPYLMFIDGDNDDDDKSGLGNINMNTKNFREWLEKQGCKKMPKPKRIFSRSYYD